jgi:hypothetical protein
MQETNSPAPWEVRQLAASDRYGILVTEPELAFADNMLLARAKFYSAVLCQTIWPSEGGTLGLRSLPPGFNAKACVTAFEEAPQWP